MGYDPTTHQVWVKLIGLPLQAWTVPEISQILQKFGHPTHILPFGQQAGHYRDVTALITTKYPTRIPLAYVYTEGEYSTQIDVLILSWRQWEDSYFPPPGNPPPPNDPLNALLNQQNDDHPTPTRHRSSSSSSNNAPSEPTIDYSSWSPRSFNTIIINSQNEAAKRHSPLSVKTYHFSILPLNPPPPLPLTPQPPATLLQPRHHTNGKLLLLLILNFNSTPQSAAQPPDFDTLLRIANLLLPTNRRLSPTSSRLPPQQDNSDLLAPFVSDLQNFVTKDPQPQSDKQSFFSKIILSLTNPIAINSPTPLSTSPVRSYNPIEAYVTDRIEVLQLHLNSVLSQSKRDIRHPHLTRATVLLRPSFKAQLSSFQNSLTNGKEKEMDPQIDSGPRRPNTQGLFNRQPHAIKQPTQSVKSFIQNLYNPNPAPSLRGYHSLNLIQNWSPDIQNLDVIQDPHPFHSPALEQAASHPDSCQQDSRPTQDICDSVPEPLPKTKELNLQPLSILQSPQTTSLSRNQQNKKKGKGKMMPTRRSQRIQAKKSSASVSLNSPNKKKGQQAKLPFDLRPHEMPLQVEEARSILTASGLQINREIEDLIQLAINQNQSAENAEDSRPPTPVHDHIPPRVIPGEDLLL